MRYFEIVTEVYVEASPDRLPLLSVMYGHGALDSEIEAEELESSRLDNARSRLEFERVRLEIEQMQAALTDDADALDAEFIRAKIAKTKAEAVATLAEL